MDTNQETGVSLDDLADLIDNEPTNEAPDAQPEDEELKAQADEQTDAEDASADDDFVEAEYEGKRYKVPAELKEALLRQADYTRKTQEVAELRRAAEERSLLLEQQQRVMGASFEKAVELRDIQNKLSQFDRVDWQSLADSDPVQATKLNIAFQQLQREAAQKTQELQATESQAQQLAAHQRQQLLQQAQRELMQRIPDFSEDVAVKLKGTAKQYGFSDAELDSIIDPRQVQVLHDAMQWRALQAQKPGVMKKVADAPKAIRPAAQQPKPRTNQAAYDRLKTKGRVEDLAAFL
jgi:hypothetical protein